MLYFLFVLVLHFSPWDSQFKLISEKSVHVGGVKKWKNSVHLVVESPHIIWIWILLSIQYNSLVPVWLHETHIVALNPFNSKLMTLTPRGGLWNFSAILALCGAQGRWNEGAKRGPDWANEKQNLFHQIAPTSIPQGFQTFRQLCMNMDQWAWSVKNI